MNQTERRWRDMTKEERAALDPAERARILEVIRGRQIHAEAKNKRRKARRKAEAEDQAWTEYEERQKAEQKARRLAIALRKMRGAAS